MTFDVLLLDLGGVLIDIDFERVFRALGSYTHVSLADMHARFEMDEMYKKHETGEITSGHYFEHLRTTFELGATDEQIETSWNQIYAGEIAENTELIARVAKRFPSYALTNSNESHRQTWEKMYKDILSNLRGVFVSSQIGLRKPEHAAYHAVCKSVGVSPARVVFFDDTYENVQGAREAGLIAYHVPNPVEFRNALADIQAL